MNAKEIFLTNTFAQAHSEEHIRLWEQFEKEVPHSQRSGAYGADSAAYIKWIKQKRDPLFMEFVQQSIFMR